MNRFIAIILAVIITFSICGCGLRQPSPSEITSADYGPYPENYQKIIIEYMDRLLADPGTVDYVWKSPPHSYEYEWLDKPKAVWRNVGGVIYYGWIVRFRLCAKSMSGEYVGQYQEVILVRSGRIIARGQYMGGPRDTSIAEGNSLTNRGANAGDYKARAKRIVLGQVDRPQFVRDLSVSRIVKVRKMYMGTFKEPMDGDICIVTYRLPSRVSGFYDQKGAICRMLRFENGRITHVYTCPSVSVLWDAQYRAGAKRHERLNMFPKGVQQLMR